MTSISPFRFDLVDSADDVTIRRAIPVGTRYELSLTVLDLTTGGPTDVTDPDDPDFDPDNFDPVDLSGFDGARGFLRLTQFAPGEPLAEFDCTIEGDGTAGEITAVLDIVETAGLQGYPRGAFDIEVYDNVASPDTNVQRVCYGNWETISEATRDDT